MNATSLLLRCREGDLPALDEFVRRYQPLIERLALAVLDDGRPENPLGAVSAVVRETIMAAVAAGEMFRDEEELTIWLYASSLKACRKHLRRRSSLALPAGGEGEDALGEPVGRQRAATHLALRQLDEQLRLPMLLHYSSGLSLAEVAQVLKVSQNTVRARMVQGREKMRIMLEGA